MSMLDELLNSQNANVLKQLAGTFGISEGDARYRRGQPAASAVTRYQSRDFQSGSRQ